MVTVSIQPFSEKIQQIVQDGFSAHTLQAIGYEEKISQVCFVANDGDQIAGVMTAEIFFGALHIKLAFVEESYRNKKVGSLLLQNMEQYGKEKGCSFAFLETLSFQALGFYLKSGYEIEFSRNGFSNGTSFHYLRKSFSDNNTSEL